MWNRVKNTENLRARSSLSCVKLPKNTVFCKKSLFFPVFDRSVRMSGAGLS